MSEKSISKMLFSKDRVDLNAAQDARNDMFKAVEKIYSNAENLVDEFENNKKRAQRQIQSVEKAYSKAEQIHNRTYDDLNKKAQDLGVPLNSIPSFEKMFKTNDFLRRKKDDIISLLKKYI